MENATLGQGIKVLELVRDKEISSEQFQKVMSSGLLADLLDANVDDVDRDSFRRNIGLKPLNPKPEPILKMISGGHNLVLGACDGTKVIAKAKKTFLSGIDSDFEKWRADEPGQATPATVLDVYEMAEDATFSQMFGFLNVDVNKLCFTQHQIIGFAEKYPDWLRTGGYATFFLFKSHGHFFVASVGVYSVGLHVYVSKFGRSDTWIAGRRHRVVVPQLALAA